MYKKIKFNKLSILSIICLIISIIILLLCNTYANFLMSRSKTTEIITATSGEGLSLTSNSEFMFSELTPAYEYNLINFGLGSNRCVDDKGNIICSLYEFNVKNIDDVYGYLDYYIIPTENTFNDLKFRVYKSAINNLSSSSELAMPETSLNRHDLRKVKLSGLIRKLYTREKSNGVDKFNEQTYTIMFYLDKEDAYNGTDYEILNAGKSFKAKLSVEMNVTSFGYVDEEKAPIIRNVNIENIERSYGDSNLGKFKVNWDGISSDFSDIEKFVVNIYDSNNNHLLSREVNDSNAKSLTINGLEFGIFPGDLYAEVYGISKNGDSGQKYCAENSPEYPYCVKSKLTQVTQLLYFKEQCESISNGSSDNTCSVFIDFSGSPASYISVSYGGSTVINVTEHSSSSGSWKVKKITVSSIDGTVLLDITSPGSYNLNNIKNDILINNIAEWESSSSSGGDSGEDDSSGCLAKGTKILLADGTYKNIEDIGYNDLLTVIDYQNGGITYQYPIWIENELVSDNYTLITFSDNTQLKVVKDHAFFSYDDNEFVQVSNRYKFNVGTKVAKLVNGRLKEVSVKSIEVINEETNYYHVVSSRYYNIIANDIVTTDDVVFVSNLYGFNNNLTWKNSIAIDKYTKDDLSFLPNYLYRGLRAYDGKYLNNIDINYDMFSNYLKTNQLNEKIWNKPTLNNNKKRQWMVTTSDDIISEKNKDSYLLEEGEYYTLKEPKNINGKKFIGWYHTGENTLHQIGEKVEVLYGTHFIAKWVDLFDSNYNYDKLIKKK